MKDGVHGDTDLCRKERGKFGPGSSGWFFHKVTTENTTINDVYEDICLKGLNPCYQKIDGQMTTVSVKPVCSERYERQ